MNKHRLLKPQPSSLRGLFAGMFMLILSGCATYEYHSTEQVELKRVDSQTADLSNEDELLDIGIILFDPGLDLLDEDSSAYTNVRRSEAVWFSSQLKKTLEDSHAWGMIRTIPSQNAITDLIVSGKIIESTGEVIKLQIDAVDATGRKWLSKEYFQRTSAYSYHPDVKSTQDPFQSLFNEVANDLLDYRAELSSEQLVYTRNVSKIRFAIDLAPETYEEYVIKDDHNIYKLQRIPAENDPMINRIERIQARNDMFLDVVQDYYRVFNHNMQTPYQEWRKSTYKEVIYERQLKNQARNEKIAGVAAILVGVLAQGSNSRTNRTAGQVAILGGAEIFRDGYAKSDEAILHTETLRELGESLELELEPSVIDLQDRSITLSGTVDDQFKEWRQLLADMFEHEQNISTQISDVSSTYLEDDIEPSLEDAQY